jgi:hypothetical protein
MPECEFFDCFSSQFGNRLACIRKYREREMSGFYTVVGIFYIGLGLAHLLHGLWIVD